MRPSCCRRPAADVARPAAGRADPLGRSAAALQPRTVRDGERLAREAAAIPAPRRRRARRARPHSARALPPVRRSERLARRRASRCAAVDTGAARCARARRADDRPGGGAVPRRASSAPRPSCSSRSRQRSALLGHAGARARARLVGDGARSPWRRRARPTSAGRSTRGSLERMTEELARVSGVGGGGLLAGARRARRGRSRSRLACGDGRLAARAARRGSRRRAPRRSRPARDAGDHSRAGGQAAAGKGDPKDSAERRDDSPSGKRSRRPGASRTSAFASSSQLSPLASAFRFLPVLANPDIDRQRHRQRDGALPSARARPRPSRRPPLGAPRTAARRARSGSCARGRRQSRPSAACTSIIARLRMSAAVPWIGKFTASRSAAPRIWQLRLLRSGTSRRRPNIVFTTPVSRARPRAGRR